jgi:ubiquinone/menaquinone biosynthesis C-methylase UbiE
MTTARAGTAYDGIPDIGVLYDLVPAYAGRGDVAFYVDEARHAGGRVLELGCGTGRITLAMARAGIDVVGVDASSEMLARCREKLAAESPDVQARVSLHHADVRKLPELGDVALAIAPFRILQHLVSIDDQLACLASTRRQLAAGGRLALDVFLPSFASMVTDRSEEQTEHVPIVLPDGRLFRRAWRIPRVRWIDQVSETELIYYVADTPESEPQRVVQAFDMRWFTHAELHHLLARSGFRVEAAYGDFARGPLTDTSLEQIVLAST